MPSTSANALCRAVIVTLALAGAACSQVGAADSPARPEAHSLRVIVGFAAPTSGAEGSALIGQSGAHAQYLSSLSPTSHAYRLICTEEDCARAIAALRQAPAILYVEPDRIKELR